jgi:hypothetical protein
MDGEAWLLEIRLFKLQPDTRAEFDRISREGTIPLMRRCGINVVAFGPSRNNDDGYFLLRAFRSEQERIELSQALYVRPEWEADYDGPITSMIADYQTAVLATTDRIIEQLAEVS